MGATLLNAWGFVAGGLLAMIGALLLARALSRSKVLLDRPNRRSSHYTLIPRAGGIAIVSAWLAAFILACLVSYPGDASFAAKLSALMLGVFLLGLADDLFDLQPLVKLAGQFAAASAYLALFSPEISLPAPLSGIESVIPASFIAVFWIVFFMNAFNFMDGVNGIAACCGALALCALALVTSHSLLWMSATLFGALALFGFLLVNLGGRLFMGDNGSQAAGFLIAVAAVEASSAGPSGASLLFIPTVMAPFLFDVSFTLGRRIIRKRQILQAHREHIYQLLVRLGRTHEEMTALYAGLTAISTMAALFAMQAGHPWIWIAPIMIILLLTPPALIVIRQAESLDLLELTTEGAARAREEKIENPFAAEA